MDKLFSLQQAIDVIKKRLFETAFNNVGIKQNIDETLVDVAENRLENWFDELPPIQPERKGTKLSTVCLLCKKPAVTFNTEDDIPYTNYSYCEDCLRKGLKLLKEQKKNLQAQPERKMGHWICESQWSDTMGTNWNTWKCDQCNVVAAKGWEHTRDGDKPNGKFCSECGAPMDEKVIFINITEKE